MTAESRTSGASLLYRSGEEKNFELPDRPEVVVGYAPGSDVVIPFQGVSRRHARIGSDGRSFWIEDAGSANRTFLNGRRVVRRERLDHLDVLTLGRYVDLVFVRKRVDPARTIRRGIVRAWLERLDGTEAGTRVDIPRGSITIGRAAINNIQSGGPAISKVHARLDRSRSALVLTDLHSANGTFVRRQRVETCMLKDGDVFSLAGERSYRVRLEEGDVETAEAEQPATGSLPAVPLPTDWKTRIEWSPEERAAFDEEREKGRGEEPAGASRPIPPTVEPSSRKPPGDREPRAPKEPASPASGGTDANPAGVAPQAPPAAPRAASPPAASEQPVASGPVDPVPGVFLEGVGRTIPLTPGDHDVGRVAAASVMLDTAAISRRHAIVHVAVDRVVLEDLGSRNGTSVCGERITAPRELKDGDVVTFGDVEFRIRFPRSG